MKSTESLFWSKSNVHQHPINYGNPREANEQTTTWDSNLISQSPAYVHDDINTT